jgi:hypothetical protein
MLWQRCLRRGPFDSYRCGQKLHTICFSPHPTGPLPGTAMTSRSNTGRDEPNSSGSWSRRLFLKVGILAAGAAVLGIGGWSQRHSIGRLLGARPTPQDSLSAQDLEDVVLISEVLFEPEDKEQSRELAATMRWWAEGRTERGPHLDLYRNGLRALENATHASGRETPFRELSPMERIGAREIWTDTVARSVATISAPPAWVATRPPACATSSAAATSSITCTSPEAVFSPRAPLHTRR